ncbi:MAG: glycosyltransferase family 4 protein [bacterium]
MKITMVGSLPPIKGMSAYCLQQVQALSRLVEIDFINFKSIYPPIFYPIAPKEEDRVFKARLNGSVKVADRLRWYNPIGSCLAGWQARTQIVHFHWWTSFLFVVFYPLTRFAKLRGRKIVCTVHNVLGHESNLFDRWLCRTMLAVPDKFIVHSEKNREQLIDVFKVDAQDIEVIPHGSYDFYKEDKVDQNEARKVLGLEATDPMILFFGHVRDYKGVDTLLQAMALVRDEIPRVKCVLAGKNWVPWEPYQAIIEKLGLHQVVQADLEYVPSSKVQYLYSAADVVVLPYRHFDSQSGPGNIALGFNKPLVVSNVGGLPDLVRDKNAVFEPGDVDGLAKALLRILTEPAYKKKLSNDSAELAKKYSWDDIARKTVDLYQKILTSNH